MTKQEFLKKLGDVLSVAYSLPDNVNIMHGHIDEHAERISFYDGLSTICVRDGAEMELRRDSDFPSTIWKSIQVKDVQLQEINYI